jgi:hydrogenase maturation protease
LSAVLQQDRGQSKRLTLTPPGLGPDTLLFGVGNCGRADDGLGWAFLDRIQAESGFDCPVEYRYQLQVEDAAQVARVRRVIFIDSYNGDLPGGFRWIECESSANFEFTTHVLPPRGVMHYCQTLFGESPRADILMIQGHDWDLRTHMSAEAEENLEKALRFFRENVLGTA